MMWALLAFMIWHGVPWYVWALWGIAVTLKAGRVAAEVCDS